MKHNKALTAVTLIIAVILLAFFGAPDKETKTSSDVTSERIVRLSPERQTHILYGDAKGGGHKYGVGKPCKSEFPQDWDDAEIIDTVKQIAANDNLDWRREDNGYFVTETFEGKTRVRVVLGPQKVNIITAYPTNVKRNPCPAKAANDN